MEMCGALDESNTETLYYCTLALDHDAGATTVTHRWEGREPDPNNSPFSREATHEWTVTAP